MDENSASALWWKQNGNNNSNKIKGKVPKKDSTSTYVYVSSHAGDPVDRNNKNQKSEENTSHPQ